MKKNNEGFSVNTYSYTQSMSASDCLRHLSKLGARYIEQMIFPGHLWIDASAAELDELRRILDGEGLKLSSLNTSHLDVNLTGAAREVRQYSLQVHEAMIRIAGKLGSPGVVVGLGKPNGLFPLPFNVMRDHLFHALDRMLPVARDLGVELWAENMPFAFLPRLDSMLETLDLYGSSEIGICYDVANAHFVGENAAQGISHLGDRLKLLHISDTTRSTFRHDPIGLGDVDFRSVGDALNTTGFTGLKVLEIISLNPDNDVFNAPEILCDRGLT